MLVFFAILFFSISYCEVVSRQLSSLWYSKGSASRTMSFLLIVSQCAALLLCELLEDHRE